MVSIALCLAELEQLRRSVVMIPDGQRVLTNDRALDLIEELVQLYSERQGRSSRVGVAAGGRSRDVVAPTIGSRSVKGRAPMAGKFELYKDAAGKFRFRLKAGNGEIIAIGEAYESKASAQNGIESVRKNAPDAVLDDQT